MYGSIRAQGTYVYWLGTISANKRESDFTMFGPFTEGYWQLTHCGSNCLRAMSHPRTVTPYISHLAFFGKRKHHLSLSLKAMAHILCHFFFSFKTIFSFAVLPFGRIKKIFLKGWQLTLQVIMAFVASFDPFQRQWEPEFEFMNFLYTASAYPNRLSSHIMNGTNF